MTPGLLEVGKIKIGRKGHEITSKKGNKFQPPEKLDHFIVTTLERDATGNYIKDANIHRDISQGGLGPEPKRIPITLLFDKISKNFQCRYVCFRGKTQWCSGDGEQANRDGEKDPVPCPCERCAVDYDGNDKCKINSTLSVMIRDARTFGGVWKFRSTSYNSAQSIYTSLYLIGQRTKGILSGLDLDLVLAPKTVVVRGTNQTSMIYVVGIEYQGTMHELREEALNIKAQSGKYLREIRLLEASIDETADPISPDEIDDAIEEYYPEQVEGYEKPKPATIDLGDGEVVDTETGEITDADDRESEPDGNAVEQQEPVPAPEQKPAKTPAKKAKPEGEPIELF
jgi:hypothetical protein